MFCRIISEGHKQDVFLLGGSDNKVHLYKEVGCYPSYNMNKIGYYYSSTHIMYHITLHALYICNEKLL